MKTSHALYFNGSALYVCATKWRNAKPGESSPQPEFWVSRPLSGDEVITALASVGCVPVVAPHLGPQLSSTAADASTAENPTGAPLVDDASITPHPYGSDYGAWMQDVTLFVDGFGPLLFNGHLGKGAAGEVDLYRAAAPPFTTYVVKYALLDEHQDDIAREFEILRQLDSRLSSKPELLRQRQAVIPTAVFHSGKYLGLQPVCSQLKLTHLNCATIVNDLVTALQVSVCAGYVHRDVRPENIMMYNGRAVLLDWGFALPLDERGQAVAKYEGTLSSASQAVLEALGRGETVVGVGPADDAESLVKALAMPYFSLQTNKGSTMVDRAQACFTSWQVIFDGVRWWKHALDAARACTSDPKSFESLKPKLVDALQYHHIRS